MEQKRVLLIPEAVTFAHVARSLTLRDAIEAIGISTEMAFDHRYDHLLASKDQTHHPLKSIPSDRFMKSANNVEFPYSPEDMRAYVEDEILLLKKLKPDLVIGDFRITLAISCRKLGIPYMSITNGYWLNNVEDQFNPPPIGVFPYLSTGIAQVIFNLMEPSSMLRAADAYNRIAQEYSVQKAQGNLYQVYTQADHALVVEPEGWLKISKADQEFSEIGPLAWNATTRSEPPWWHELSSSELIVYLSLGSSGNADLIDLTLQALNAEQATVIVSGRPEGQHQMCGLKILSAPFLNSRKIMEKAHLLISNGGSLSMVDALCHGKPILGLASNYDQMRNMTIAENHGVGKLIYHKFSGQIVLEGIRSLTSRSNVRDEALDKAKRLFSKQLNSEKLKAAIVRTLNS